VEAAEVQKLQQVTRAAELKIPNCISQTGCGSRGDARDTRRTLAGDNCQTPGSAFSLRRAS
jgi:hypothetical protein